MIGLLPTAFLPKWMLISWIGIFKFAQGFAMGGSYGQNYISVYESSPNWRCYRVSIVQMGFLLGMTLGEISMFLLKIAGSSVYGSISPFFLSWGWRIPFLLSSLIGAVLLMYSDQLSIENIPNTTNNNKPDLFKYLCIFLVIGIEMNLFYMWFVYSPIYREFISNSAFPAFISWLQKGLMLILFPIMGIFCDMVKSNSTVLLVISGMMVALSPFAPWNGFGMFFASTLIGAACYASLIPWSMSVLSRSERRSVLGPLFSLASSILGGTIPLLAVYIQENFGMRYVGGLMMVYAFMSIIGLLFVSNKKTSEDR
jgi:hypothetical protein